MKYVSGRFVVLPVFVVVMIMLTLFVSSADADSKKNFARSCAKCHGIDGNPTKRGKSLGAKNFRKVDWQKSITDKEMLNSIANGKNKMPSWKKSYNAEEIKELIHYVRVLVPSGQRKKMPKNVQSLHYK